MRILSSIAVTFAFALFVAEARASVFTVNATEIGGNVNLARSLRNLPRVAVVAPSELDVAAVVWARSLLVSQAALAGLVARAGAGAGQAEEKVEASS